MLDPSIHGELPSEALVQLSSAARKASRDTGLRLLAGVIIAAALVISLRGTDLWALGWMLAIAVMVLAGVAAAKRRARFGRDVAAAAAPALARASGLQWVGSGIPPCYEAASRLLFASRPTAEFANIFSGTDENRRFSICQATLSWTEYCMDGLLFVFETARTVPSMIVLRPNAGVLSISPAPGLARVGFEDDRDFERRFQVHSQRPSEASSWVVKEARDLLVDLWGQGSMGQVYGYFCDRQAFIFIGGGRLIRSSPFRPADVKTRLARIRSGFADSLGQLDRLMRAFG